MSLHLSAMQAMAEYSGYAGVFCVNTAHGLENENLDRPCRGKVPAGPAPQDARYPQSRRLRFRLRHQPRAVRAADTWHGGHAGPTSFFTKLCGIRQKPEILHSDFGSKVSGEG
jgi:hypothetical protein